MTQLVEITKSDLELIESLEFDENADKHCESSGHDRGDLGHFPSAQLWYVKFGCGCLFEGVFVVCGPAVDVTHILLERTDFECPFGYFKGNPHKTDIVKIEPVK